MLILQLSTSDYISLVAIITTIVVPSAGAAAGSAIHFINKTRSEITDTKVKLAILSEKMVQAASQAQVAVLDAKLSEAASKSQMAVIEAKVDLLMTTVIVKDKPT